MSAKEDTTVTTEAIRYLEANLTAEQILAAKAKLQAARVPMPTSVILPTSHLLALRRQLFVTSLVRIRRMYTHLLPAVLHARRAFLWQAGLSAVATRSRTSSAHLGRQHGLFNTWAYRRWALSFCVRILWSLTGDATRKAIWRKTNAPLASKSVFDSSGSFRGMMLNPTPMELSQLRSKSLGNNKIELSSKSLAELNSWRNSWHGVPLLGPRHRWFSRK